MSTNDLELTFEDNMSSSIACNDTVSYTGDSFVNYISPSPVTSTQDDITELGEQGTLAIKRAPSMTSLDLGSMEHTYANDEVMVENLQP